MFDLQVMIDCLNIARDIAPFDTGNLRFNAIKLIQRPFGFTIEYLLHVAPYTLFLQRGTKKSSKHQGFINDTAFAIGMYMRKSVQGLSNNLNSTNKRITETAKNTPARNRRFLQSMGYTQNTINPVMTKLKGI
jgi:hypothetical protein